MTGSPYSAPGPRGYQLRRRLRRIVARCAARMAPRDAERRTALGILTYHRLVPEWPSGTRPTWAVTPERLTQQLFELRRRGFRPLALAEALRSFQESREVPPRSFVVTFDDGYANNLLYAAPVLERFRTPATVFLATRYLDAAEPFPFEDWRPARLKQAPPAYWRPLTRGQCERLRDAGLVEFGSHTHTHQNYLRRPAELAGDLALSLAVLRDRFGIVAPSFSFPFGATDAELIAVARAAGVTCGLTTRERRVVSGEDPFHWGRFGVERNDDGATLAAKLDGRYTALCGQVRRWLAFGAASRDDAPTPRASRPSSGRDSYPLPRSGRR